MSAKRKQPKALKLSDYTPEAANAKISVLALWKHLEALDTVADDPAAVKTWSEKIFKEVQKCEVV